MKKKQQVHEENTIDNFAHLRKIGKRSFSIQVK